MLYNKKLLHPPHEATHVVGCNANTLSTVSLRKTSYFCVCDHLFLAQGVIVPANSVTKLRTGNDCRNFHCDHLA